MKDRDEEEYERLARVIKLVEHLANIAEDCSESLYARSGSVIGSSRMRSMPISCSAPVFFERVDLLVRRVRRNTETTCLSRGFIIITERAVPDYKKHKTISESYCEEVLSFLKLKVSGACLHYISKCLPIRIPYFKAKEKPILFLMRSVNYVNPEAI
jgi:hypothetical protein